MLRMSLLAVIALALMGCALAPPAHAQDAKGSPGANGRKVMRVKASPCWDKLGLSDKQKAAVKAVNEKYRLKMREIRQSGKTDEEKKAALKKLAESRKAEIGRVLTKEQLKKLQECMKAEKGKEGTTPAKGARKARKVPPS